MYVSIVRFWVTRLGLKGLGCRIRVGIRIRIRIRIRVRVRVRVMMGRACG